GFNQESKEKAKRRVVLLNHQGVIEFFFFIKVQGIGRIFALELKEIQGDLNCLKNSQRRTIEDLGGRSSFNCKCLSQRRIKIKVQVKIGEIVKLVRL
ncbi:hypothetical protein L195_g037106, partial [Trifolium pratense]